MRVEKLLRLLEENENVYCHITSNLDEDGYFYPRVPDVVREEEDTTINRVCVAKTIDGALTAIPNGGGRLEYYLDESSYYFKVFIIDTKKLGITKIVDSEELYKKDYVRDAEITGEKWILESFTVPKEDIFYIKLDTWHESAKDVIPYKIYKLSENDEYGGDYIEAYYDVYEDYAPCTCVIENAKFLTQDVKAGDEVEIDLEFVPTYSSKKELKEKFIESNPEIEFIDDEDDENIIFIAKKDQDISKIIHTDWYYKHCI